MGISGDYAGIPKASGNLNVLNSIIAGTAQVAIAMFQIHKTMQRRLAEDITSCSRDVALEIKENLDFSWMILKWYLNVSVYLSTQVASHSSYLFFLFPRHILIRLWILYIYNFSYRISNILF